MKLTRYIIAFLCLTCSSHLMSMQGRDNILLGSYIMNADFKKFKSLFDNQQASVHDIFDGTPILTMALEVYAALKDQTTPADQELNTIANMIQFLLEQGAPLKIPDTKGDTALHVAAHKNLYQFIPLLLDYGAEINTQDKQGNTSLHRAVKSTLNGVINPDAPKVVGILLDHGAHTSLVNNKGLTAYQVALNVRDAINKSPRIIFDMADITQEQALQTVGDVIDIFNTHKLKMGLQKIREREIEKSSIDMRFKFQ